MARLTAISQTFITRRLSDNGIATAVDRHSVVGDRARLPPALLVMESPPHAVRLQSVPQYSGSSSVESVAERDGGARHDFAPEAISQPCGCSRLMPSDSVVQNSDTAGEFLR